MIAGRTEAEPFIMLLIGTGIWIHLQDRAEKFIKAPSMALNGNLLPDMQQPALLRWMLPYAI